MALIAGTPIFTNHGWKNIEDIAGHDRVLVKNFIDDAEFIQPFALQKRQYDGEIIHIGAKDFSFSVTPDHPIVYDKNKYADGKHFMKSAAIDFIPEKDTRIYRKFKYMFSEDHRRELITVRDEFGKRHVTVAPHDWYKLIGYVLCRGYIRMKPGRPMLWFFLEPERVEEETYILGDILDRVGLGWHVQHTEKTRPRLVVSSKNTLASRLITRLGARKRKEMFLPDTIIYNSSKELSKLLIETIIDASIKPNTERRHVYQLATTNTALIDSLTLLGTLAGYSMRTVLSHRIGEPAMGGFTKKNSYILQISQPTETYAPKYKKIKNYHGLVYEIDLFEGQIYTKEGSMPVWMNPK